MSNRTNFTQDRYLTEYARMLAPSADTFIAYNPLANPVIDVGNMKGNFIDVEGGFGNESPFDDMVIGDAMERPNIIKADISEVDGYTINDMALGVLVNKRSQAYSEGDGNDLRRAKTAVLMKNTAIIRERVLAALVFNATTFAGFTAAAGTQWDAVGSNPVDDAMIAQDSILTNAGEKMNTLILGYETYKGLRTNDRILELWSRTGSTGGIIPDSALARIMDVDNIVVGAASSNTAAENLTESKSFIWGKFALFCKIAQSPTPYTPQSCIQRFRFRGAGDPTIHRYDLPGQYVEQIDAVYSEQFTVPTPALGYLFSAVVS